MHLLDNSVCVTTTPLFDHFNLTWGSNGMILRRLNISLWTKERERERFSCFSYRPTNQRSIDHNVITAFY